MPNESIITNIDELKGISKPYDDRIKSLDDEISELEKQKSP